MDDRLYRTVEILFFGAGKKGRYWLDYCKSYGLVPMGMVDNNPALNGSMCDDVRIYAPDSLKTLSYNHIFITCNREEEIYQQLIGLGVPDEKIIKTRHNFMNHFLYYATEKLEPLKNSVKAAAEGHKEKVLFDLQNGMVLGGVEAWTYSLAEILKDNGYQGLYVTTDAKGPIVMNETYPTQILTYEGLPDEKDKVALCVKTMIENLPCVMVCNFPQNIFWSACIVKRLYPDSIRIIAVQHSDDELYYETYSLWKDLIDECMVISSRIEEKLIMLGMEKEKTCCLGWEVPCEENLNRVWNMGKAPLQIGYVGRVTKISKRVDFLPILAEKLREKGIRFQMNIAGAGDYEEVLKQKIEEEGLNDCVRLTGYIDREKIPEFWMKQDIMAGCSEREGHSISQSEAMASGAVPVITDVSGARDDVTDGYNGYVVPVGDIDALADRICKLYNERDLLAQMGKNAHETIFRRQQEMNETAFWDELLRKVWQ